MMVLILTVIMAQTRGRRRRPNYSGEYGATTGPDTGAAFLIPSAVLTARLIKVGMQLTF